MHLIATSQVYHTREKRIYGRSSVVPNVFLNHEILIYAGKK
jgi:hypothetical protein